MMRSVTLDSTFSNSAILNVRKRVRRYSVSSWGERESLWDSILSSGGRRRSAHSWA